MVQIIADCSFLTYSAPWGKRIQRKVVNDIKNILSLQQYSGTLCSWLGAFNFCDLLISHVLSIPNHEPCNSTTQKPVLVLLIL